jgi:hypothetical protein
LIVELHRRAGEILAGPKAEILGAVREAGAVHVDEAGWRKQNKKAWLWVGATDLANAFQVDLSRAFDTLRALLGEDPGRDRVIISDRLQTYTRAPNRQLFWAHVRRDFRAKIDRASGRESIGRRPLDQSRWVFTWWGRFAEGSIARPMLRSYAAAWRGEVGHLLRGGAARGCPWTAKACRTFPKAEVHGWRFAEVEGVVPGNNAAECALRQGVIRLKRSLGTASEAGSRFVERLL